MTFHRRRGNTFALQLNPHNYVLKAPIQLVKKLFTLLLGASIIIIHFVSVNAPTKNIYSSENHLRNDLSSCTKMIARSDKNISKDF